jgi:hypothetical protein
MLSRAMYSQISRTSAAASGESLKRFTRGGGNESAPHAQEI